MIISLLKTYSRSEHSLSRKHISGNALEVLYQLDSNGYDSYLVGGSVRDLLLEREPKDFDIATNAKPEQICELFNRCRLIGRRFRLAHIHFRYDVIEVATFRGAADSMADKHISDSGQILNDNVFGNIEEDALRRDFTVNALYYNIRDFSLVDYQGGLEDLNNGILRLIGDPETRYREDPVRMLRAVRLAAKMGFTLFGKAESLLPEMGYLLQDMPPSRLFEEIKKLLLSGYALATFQLLRNHQLFDELFPQSKEAIDQNQDLRMWDLIDNAMRNTDTRIIDDKPVTPAFLFAVLLWPAVKAKFSRYKNNKRLNSGQALEQACREVTEQQVRITSIPKRFSHPMKDIWRLQPRFENQGDRNSKRLLAHPKFRAAYDFMLLRSEVGEVDQALAQWWTDLQKKSGPQPSPKMRNSRYKNRRR